jgi:hypothetical protein
MEQDAQDIYDGELPENITILPMHENVHDFADENCSML